MMTPTKVTRRRRQPPAQAQEEAIPESIFDALARHGAIADTQTAKEEKKPNEPSVADLMKQIETMSKRLDEADRVNLALTSAVPQVQNSVPAPVKPVLNLDNLPDPLDDPKGYAKALAERTIAFNTAQSKYDDDVRRANTPAPGGDGEALFQEFAEAYAEYAEDQEGVMFATQKVLAQAKRKGIDPQRYMYQNSDRFFRDVVKTYDARFGKPGEEEDQGQQQPALRRTARRQEAMEEEEPANRTGGIMGGIDNAARGAPQPLKPGDFIKDLQDVQRKTGYF